MSGILAAVSEMSGMLVKVREVLGKKSCQGKVAYNCLLLAPYLCEGVSIDSALFFFHPYINLRNMTYIVFQWQLFYLRSDFYASLRDFCPVHDGSKMKNFRGWGSPFSSRFLNARLPGGSYCMRGMRFVFADIVRAYHKTLWRIVVEAQVASAVFVQGPQT